MSANLSSIFGAGGFHAGAANKPHNTLSESERALNALHCIPADVTHDDWARIVPAAKAAGIAKADFLDWAAGAGDGYHAGQVKAEWNSFKDVGGIGAGTLFFMAREHGYSDSGAAPAQRTKPAAKPLQSEKPQPRPGMAPAEVWARLVAVDDALSHDYIQRKGAVGVPLGDLRQVPKGDSLSIAGHGMAGALAVPCRGADGALVNIQFIAGNDLSARMKAAGMKADKLNLPGCKVEGWHVVGEIVQGGTVHLCEGVGAAWSCWQSTGDAAVACFGSGNVGKVAHQLREADKAARLVLVADVGQEVKTMALALEVGALVALMPGGWPDNSDINDLYQKEGFEAVEDLLHAAKKPPRPEGVLKTISVFDVLTNPSPAPSFVWEGYLPRGTVSLFGAHGGTGKSMLGLMLSVCVVLGRPMFGVPTERANVLFVSLEDGAHIVRHRLALICKTWGINPAELAGKLHMVDGTANPELFTAETRGAGELTVSYHEVRQIVKSEHIGLTIVDNASDAYGGDEIQRKQVRAFMRSLAEIARLNDGAVVLLAHVDKGTSRARKAEGGEGYSGSTAWHNSARSRFFMSRAENDGELTLEHQKSNLGKKHEPLTLVWPEGGLPMLAGDAPDFSELVNGQGAQGAQGAKGRADDKLAIEVLKLIAEFEERGQFCSPTTTARNNVYAMLKSEPSFAKLKLNSESTKRIVTQCQRAKWLEPVEYRTPDRKTRERWTLTNEGQRFAGVFAPSAPSAPSYDVSAQSAQSAKDVKEGAPSAPSYVGGVGESARAEEGAQGAEEGALENPDDGEVVA